MDEGNILAIGFLALYFLPAYLHVTRSADGLVGNLLFLCLCLVVNWTVIGWIGMMAVAEHEKGPTG